MRYEIKYSPAFALGVVQLEGGEAVRAEAGAMVSMSPTIQMQTEARGGVFKGLKRSVLGGESFFINTFTAAAGGGEVTFAPALPGDIIALEIAGQSLLIQSGSYLVNTAGIEIDTKFGGGRTFFSSEGLFLIKATGTGTIFLSSYGAVHQLDLAAGQQYIVDTGHMVAFDESVTYEVTKAAGWKSTLFGGEGLVVRLTGPGRFYMQTRAPSSFLSWLIPKLPGRRE